MQGSRRKHGRKARFTLGWSMLAFVGLQLFLSLILECSRADFWDPDYALKTERLLARLKEVPGRPLVLMIGSSRTLQGFQAARVGGGETDRPILVFNFGLSGTGPVLERVCLKRLLAQGVRPDLLLVEVLPAALTRGGHGPVEENWLSGSRLPTRELAWVQAYSCNRLRLLRQWCISRCLFGTDHRADLRRRLALDQPRSGGGLLPDKAMDGHGWEPQFWSVTPAQRARYVALSRGQYGDAAGDSRLAKQPLGALTDLVASCRAEGIAMALVLMPEASEFRTLYTPLASAHINTFLDQLRQRCHVPLIDARTWVKDAGFWDGHHLLPSGAAAFTERFEREALRPLLHNLFRKRPGGGQYVAADKHPLFLPGLEK